MGMLADLLVANQTTLMLTVLLMIAAMIYSFKTSSQNQPPMVKYSIPFLGSAISYGIDPVKFLQDCAATYGDCFTFIMMGRRMTFCLNPEGNHFVFNIPLASASAEDIINRAWKMIDNLEPFAIHLKILSLILGAYEKLTTPVFGSGVVYDVENSLFMEQKKFIKDALTVTAFKKYVGYIREEVTEFLSNYDEFTTVDLFQHMSELTIRTASRCLMGKEIRAQLHSNVAKLYHDLDAGFAPINVFFRWLPLPAYFARDKANKTMTELFKGIIHRRRLETKDRKAENENYEPDSDIISTLIDASYKDGSKPDDDAKAHIMIALLMGGQHTSSTTLSWIIYELTRRPDVIAEILKEQSLLLTGKPDTNPKDLPDFDYEQLRKLEFLDCVLKETLRLHPPLHTIMRKVEKDISYKGFTIPKGDFLCGSKAVSQLDPVRFPDPKKFEPSRFLNNNEGSEEWSIQAVNIAQKSAKSHFLPFGAGRHRCIGEAFAYVQIKTIISSFIRNFEFELVGDNFPKPDYSSMVVVPQRNTMVSFRRRV